MLFTMQEEEDEDEETVMYLFSIALVIRLIYVSIGSL